MGAVGVCRTWLPPVWVPWLHGFRRGVPWDQQIRDTADGKARYAQHVDIEALEMSLVDPSNVIAHELPRTRRAVRMFWMDTGAMIGASCGEETTMVYVEWAQSGAVHGRPITLAELKRKGLS